VSTQFDPFRFNQVYEPEPVEGQLPSVCLVDEETELPTGRPGWFRTLAGLMIAIFLVTTILTALRQIISQAHIPEAEQPT